MRIPLTDNLGAGFAVAGAMVRVHWSCLPALAWFIWLALVRGHAGWTLIVTLALLGVATLCLVAHELGHVLAAKRLGIATREVLLTPLGALSRLERHPERPIDELAIAAAGPAVSLILALALLPIALDDPLLLHPSGIAYAGGAAKLFWINIAIAALNLLPAAPLDGGRMLGAAAEMLFGDRIAARLVLVVGLLAAAGFVAAGVAAADGSIRVDDRFLHDIVLGSPAVLYVLAAVFGYGAIRQWREHLSRQSLRPLAAGEAATRQFECLTPEQKLVPMIDAVFASAQRDFPVLSPEGRFLGMVTREDFARGVAGGQDAQKDDADGENDVRKVADIMRTDVWVAHAGEPLATAIERMRRRGMRVMPVLDADIVIGVLMVEEAEAAEAERQAWRDRQAAARTEGESAESQERVEASGEAG